MNNNDEKILITQEGLDKLKKEYQGLIENKRPTIVERLTNSRQDGDLAENSEYIQAKEELSFIEGRISELEEVINRASVIHPNHNGEDAVYLGCEVTVKANTVNESLVFRLVGEWEADPLVKKISHTSPLGKSLIGKKVGDSFEVEAPVGKITYRVLKIN